MLFNHAMEVDSIRPVVEEIEGDSSSHDQCTQQKPRQYTVVSIGYLVPGSHLGSLYTSVTDYLLKHRATHWRLRVVSTSTATATNDGTKKKATSVKLKINGRFHLLLAEAQAIGLSYSLLSNYSSTYTYENVPICNYTRGFEAICKKMNLLLTMRSYSLQTGLHMCDDLHIPMSYYYNPNCIDDEETQTILAAITSAASHTLWILKPSDGSKGKGIHILDSANVGQFLNHLTPGGCIWVIQLYINNPLLITLGKRKFDIRVWVLFLSNDYSVYVYKDGVLRVASVTYSNDYTDTFAHLSNHCIALNHTDYGRYEPTNELLYPAFDELLNGTKSVALDLQPQIDSIIKHVFVASRDMLTSSTLQSFMLYGFDFMVDDEYKVWLLEVNSSPAVCEQLLPQLTADLVGLAIDTRFPCNDTYSHAAAGDAIAPDATNFVSLSLND